MLLRHSGAQVQPPCLVPAHKPENKDRKPAEEKAAAPHPSAERFLRRARLTALTTDSTQAMNASSPRVLCSAAAFCTDYAIASMSQVTVSP